MVCKRDRTQVMVGVERPAEVLDIATDCKIKNDFDCSENDTNVLDKHLTDHSNSLNRDDGRIATKVQDHFVALKKLRRIQNEQNYNLRLPLVTSDENIVAADRDSAVTTMKSMQKFYNYDSETLALAANYLDRFIAKMKVKRKYMSCVAATSFFLAVKMNEEYEYHPTATDLARLNRYSWKPSDLKRMEMIMLEKLDWKLFPTVTCLSFIEVIYELLRLVEVNIDKTFLRLLIQHWELYLNYTSCLSFDACTLALSVIQQCLKEAGLYTQVTSFLLSHILHVCQVSDTEYYDCQCAISWQLQCHNLHPATHPRCLPLPKLVPRVNLVVRPSYYCSSELQTIEEVPWNNESSVDTTTSSQVLVTCSIIDQFHGTRKTNTAWDYCPVVDQCLCSDRAINFCEIKCNSSL